MDKLYPYFILILHPTYFNMGFFNINVDNERYIGEDNEFIEIHNENMNEVIIGKINRSVNRNNTPRIMGGSKLKKWFNENSHIMGKIKVEILNKNRIFLKIIH